MGEARGAVSEVGGAHQSRTVDPTGLGRSNQAPLLATAAPCKCGCLCSTPSGQHLKPIGRHCLAKLCRSRSGCFRRSISYLVVIIPGLWGCPDLLLSSAGFGRGWGCGVSGGRNLYSSIVDPSSKGRRQAPPRLFGAPSGSYTRCKAPIIGCVAQGSVLHRGVGPGRVATARKKTLAPSPPRLVSRRLALPPPSGDWGEGTMTPIRHSSPLSADPMAGLRWFKKTFFSFAVMSQMGLNLLSSSG